MKKILTTGIWGAALLLIAVILLVYEGDQLWKVQEMNLFLTSSLFFKQQMVVPGGMLTYIGTWFTALLYYPVLGVAVLCILWGLLMWMTKRTFRIANHWAVVVLIPVALLLLTNMDQGYWVYVLKLRGHFFITTLGTMMVVALLWAFRLLPSQYGMRFLCMAFTCVAGYPLAGIYGLAATLLMGLWSWRLEKKWTMAALHTMLALLLVIVVPLLCYRYVYYQTNLDNIYWAELPLYFITERHQAYYIPFYLLALYYVVLILWPVKTIPLLNKKYSIWTVSVVMMAGMVVGIYHFWFKDENFHRELAMQHCIEKLDWQGVVDEAAAQDDEPTRAIVVMKNLALARLGRQGIEMFHYKNGSKESNAPFPMRMLLDIGALAYYHYGMANCCNRISMEMGVEFEWRTEHYKYLVRSAILNEEPQLARKYLGILRQTMFAGEWADRFEPLIDNPALKADDPEMGFITHMMHYDNLLTSDQGFVEDFIMKRLAASNYTGDSIFQEQALLATFFTRDVEKFWKHLTNYVRLHPHDQLPIHVQEAAILYGSLEERSNLDSWPFDQSVRDSYRRFNEITPRFDNMEVEPVRQALYPMFGKTYYYDYYLMDNLPQY